MQRRKFGREFKIEAFSMIKDRGVSVAQASRDLDVHENVLRKWVREPHLNRLVVVWIRPILVGAQA